MSDLPQPVGGDQLDQPTPGDDTDGVGGTGEDETAQRQGGAGLPSRTR